MKPHTLTSAKESYPALFIFGDQKIEQMSHDDEEVASFDDRLRSVWPLIVLQVLDFFGRLPERERGAMDPEDMVHELWIALKERDKRWEISRGRYFSFASAVVRSSLAKLRPKAFAVQPPLNGHARLIAYRDAEASGDLPEESAVTMARLEAALRGQRSMDEAGELGEAAQSAEYNAIRAEEIARARREVVAGLAALEAREALVLGLTYGLWGGSPKTAREVSGIVGRSPRAVTQIVERAMQKFRDNP